jgi:hypothetical protein
MRSSYRLTRSVRILVAVSFITIPIGLMVSPAAANDPVVRAPSSPESAAPSYKAYFVEFRSRHAASYGHMYVLYGQVNGHGEIVESDIAGLHPKGDANDCDNCSLFPWTVGHVLFVPSETGASNGDKKPTERSMNGDDYIRRLRKDVAKRRLERAAKRSERAATEGKIKPEDKTPLRT